MFFSLSKVLLQFPIFLLHFFQLCLTILQFHTSTRANRRKFLPQSQHFFPQSLILSRKINLIRLQASQLIVQINQWIILQTESTKLKMILRSYRWSFDIWMGAWLIAWLQCLRSSNRTAFETILFLLIRSILRVREIDDWCSFLGLGFIIGYSKHPNV